MVGRVGLEPTTFGLKSPGCRGFASLVRPLPTLATPVIRKSERHPAATGAAEERPECWQDVGSPEAMVGEASGGM